MNAVRFHVVVGADRVLTLPEGVELSPGPAEVIILQTKDSQSAADLANRESVSEHLARKGARTKPAWSPRRSRRESRSLPSRLG